MSLSTPANMYGSVITGFGFTGKTRAPARERNGKGPYRSHGNQRSSGIFSVLRVIRYELPAGSCRRGVEVFDRPREAGSRRRHRDRRTDRSGPRASGPRPARSAGCPPGRSAAGDRWPTDSSPPLRWRTWRRPPTTTVTRAPTPSRLDFVPSRPKHTQWPGWAVRLWK